MPMGTSRRLSPNLLIILKDIVPTLGKREFAFTNFQAENYATLSGDEEENCMDEGWKCPLV